MFSFIFSPNRSTIITLPINSFKLNSSKVRKKQNINFKNAKLILSNMLVTIIDWNATHKPELRYTLHN